MGKSFDRSKALQLLSFLLLLAGAGLVLLPLATVFLVSLSPSGVGVKTTGLTLANYQEAWRRGNFLLAFLNSTLVALAVTAFQVVTSALAGYALARLKFRGRQALVLGVLATLVIPFQLLVIPIFLVLKWGHLLNTYGALILPTATNGFGKATTGSFYTGKKGKNTSLLTPVLASATSPAKSYSQVGATV